MRQARRDQRHAGAIDAEKFDKFSHDEGTKGTKFGIRYFRFIFSYLRVLRACAVKIPVPSNALAPAVQFVDKTTISHLFDKA
jgi:hypothetical protein